VTSQARRRDYGSVSVGGKIIGTVYPSDPATIHPMWRAYVHVFFPELPPGWTPPGGWPS
jgi:hypothetical protein